MSNKIKLYRNGFIVNDGPFRSSSAPENKPFLEKLASGHVPEELAGQGTEQGVDVGLEDCRGEDYVPPPAPAYVAYGGTGVVLSSSAATDSGTGAGADGTVVDPAALGVAAPEVSTTEPTTTVQVKLLSGKKIRVRLNTSHSVGQLCAAISRDGGGPQPYRLAVGFPPRDLTLTSLETSVAEAGLQGASVTLKSASV